MEEYFKLYERWSNPLKECKFFSKGDVVYTSTGDCFQCVQSTNKEGGEISFLELHESVLNSGERIETLNKDVLNLFWTLSDKSFHQVLSELPKKIQKNDEGNEVQNTL